jgi:tetratricopeptide (TPR) repeat protein
MKMRFAIWTGALALAIIAAAGPRAFAQQAPQGATGSTGQPGQKPDMAPPSGAIEAPKPDPAEEAAYKVFFNIKSSDDKDTIKTGEDFIQKYPNSRYREGVYSRLAQAYYLEQNMDKMYANGGKVLELNPDNVDILVLEGWVLPHSYNPQDPDAERNMAKAEGYEKHALELIPKITKPAQLSDADFAKSRDALTSQAHSGLGLVYFRQGKPEDSIAEFKKSIELSGGTDATDFFVMGFEQKQLKKYDDAVDSFDKCAKIPSTPLADRCTQQKDQTKKLATGAAAPAPKP